MSSLRSVYRGLIFLASIIVMSATIPRPRGVPKSLASKYQEDGSKTFICMDGSRTIPFDYVNDDYCDCIDGSDEPGTSACPNGQFHCTNAGYKPGFIPSSRVNDGVCDCCDGGDEYSGNINCVNNCKELGKKLKEEQLRMKQLLDEGQKKRKEFAEEGKRMREEKKTKLEQLQAERQGLETTKKDTETKKEEAEIPEKEAKEKLEKAWNEEKERRDGERETMRAKAAFDELDTDKDGFVDILEMIVHIEFDIDSNGDVSEDEAKEHLEDNDKVNQEVFITRIWPSIKQLFKSLLNKEEVKDGQADHEPTEEAQGETAAPPGDNQVPPPTESSTPPPHFGGEEEEDDEHDEFDDEDEDDEHDIHELDKLEKDTVDEKEIDVMPEYDEETKSLIAVADEARKQFNEADSKLRDVDKEISDLQSYLNQDFGPEDEFAVLKDQCYEYTDREYTYKLCPYDRASQRPKNGGGETNLGLWGKWTGPEDNKYTRQLYEKGQNCWNGPDRSVTVHFSCGMEHKITNAYEPSRCEYAFDFSTPASCSLQAPAPEIHEHDEL